MELQSIRKGNNMEKTFESLDQELFQTLENEEMSSLNGGDISDTMSFADPSAR